MNDDELENIDSSWIEEFENLDKEYKDYYTEDLAVINIHCIYVNKADEIERVLENKLILKTPGIVSKEEILGLIKHNMICNEVKYSLLYILKFNINLEPIYLKNFVRSKEPLISIGNQFIQSIKNIDEIKLDKSISMFHDLNDLLIIFHDKTNLTSSANISYHNKVKTKKIYLNLNSTSFKKTKRNIFKDNML
jgi:hypothetical protein